MAPVRRPQGTSPLLPPGQSDMESANKKKKPLCECVYVCVHVYNIMCVHVYV